MRITQTTLATSVKVATKSCGFCAVEIRSETAVHPLERGAVRTTSGPGRDEDQVWALRGSIGRLDKSSWVRCPAGARLSS